MECGTDEELKETARTIRDANEEYKKMRHLQYEFIENHREMAEGIYEVTYSDGTVVEIDYKENKFYIRR